MKFCENVLFDELIILRTRDLKTESKCARNELKVYILDQKKKKRALVVNCAMGIFSEPGGHLPKKTTVGGGALSLPRPSELLFSFFVRLKRRMKISPNEWMGGL